MSDILETAVSALSSKIDGQSFDASVKFALEGVGAIRIDESGVSVDDGDADCTLSADPELFQAIIEGDTNPTAAFMTGKLKIDGDMSVAMKLGSLLA